MGHLDESTFISEVYTAHRILASTIEERLFLNEQETEFEFLYHFDSVDEWTSYLEAHSFGDPEADKPLIETTRNLMSQGQGEIVIRELVRATRIKRLG